VSSPLRIQLRRARGWRKPAGAVVVARPTKWGNPYKVGAADADGRTPMTAAVAVARYRYALTFGTDGRLPTPGEIERALRGKDLACWCPPGQPCHADVLIEVANR
jgi:hypothetical protein